jgi:hypothetical protein
MAIQILLTVLVTGGCTFLATNFVTVSNNYLKLQKWFMWTVRISLIVHAIVFPASIINLIWSF